MKLTSFIFFACCFLHAYQDEELNALWASIPDINQPTLKDYQRIETYLSQGKRPYLDLLREQAPTMDQNTSRRLNNLLHFKLVGEDGKMPIFEIHHLNLKETAKKRCILLFGSFNGIYEEKARMVLEELKSCGYSGDVLLRIGGFPNVQKGRLKICHVPYAFKAAFLEEARERGYKQVLWIDTCMHPLDHLEVIFEKIQSQGYFFCYAGTLRENEPKNLLPAARALNIGLSDYDEISHISSGILGLHMGDHEANQLLDDWLTEIEKVVPNVTWFPEELSLSVIAWRLGLKPYGWIGDTMCGENELGWIHTIRPTLQFYCENIR